MDNLKYFLSCYFHQDWDHYGPTWRHAVDAFMGDSPARVAAVPGEIDALLNASQDDDELGSEMDSLGNYYDPPEGNRMWLQAVRDHIRSHS